MSINILPETEQCRLRHEKWYFTTILPKATKIANFLVVQMRNTLDRIPSYKAWNLFKSRVRVSDTSRTPALLGHALDTCRTPLYCVTINFFFPTRTRAKRMSQILLLARHLSILKEKKVNFCYIKNIKRNYLKKENHFNFVESTKTVSREQLWHKTVKHFLRLQHLCLAIVASSGSSSSICCYQSRLRRRLCLKIFVLLRI